MKKSLDDIQEMLDALPLKTWRFDGVREDALTKTGALRTTAGQNVVEPSHESASMVVGLRASIDFLAEAPMIVQQLLDMLNSPSKVVPAKEAPEKGEKAEKDGDSA